ncbi:Nucleoside 2-deoxyribosyltransferase [Desulfuromusa kysingii]|uniref:Nucleoside 2-deoxyribosyltransferase n=1 Tax=Desulfuromusa kysingii TaxID=37625 RepID=A0A1H4E6W0_9BACT|nr:nucleoside 2-deoxyribosyltransferase [Desulfuromusa kysingii]SEA80082.1 Nucleoside 2-deoxyribosyltransferase [Desulfuromusa kysingii]
MQKIYLAGPDVFEPDAIRVGEKLKQLVAEYGFCGLFPLDNVISTQGSPQAIARAIRAANINLIQSADIVMANLNPFRGIEPDSGTVFEVGFATALGKEVYCYAADCREMITRIREKQRLDATATRCQDGKIIEDFKLSHNLMMIDQVVAVDAASCLAYIKKQHQTD